MRDLLWLDIDIPTSVVRNIDEYSIGNPEDGGLEMIMRS